MGLKKKTVATNVAENSLKKKAEENTTVTRGTSKNQKTLKEGVPNDHSRKHLGNVPVVGVNLGTTLNMGDYESLRVDCWLSDEVHENETIETAFQRVVGIADKVLQETVQSYRE